MSETTNSAPTSAPMEYPVDVSVKSLLAAGTHFGHQTDRWNPKMLPFIYCKKNGIHILNLDITMQQWKKTRQFITETVGRGGNVLFVGTKTQAREIIKQEAQRCNGHYVVTRWLGGTLSNFQTIKKSIERMKKLEDLLAQANVENSKVRLSKKERLDITRQIQKLDDSLGGIRAMKKVPDAMFVVDILKEDIAVAEARRLRIPVIALTDSNVNPEIVEFPIASNDDATRTIRLFSAAVADAIIEGRTIFESRSRKGQAQRGGDKPGSGDAGSTAANA